MEESGIYIMTNPEISNSEIKYYTFDEALALVKLNVDKTLKQSPKMIQAYMVHLAKSQGKFLRGRALLVCALNDKNEIHENAVYLAVSIELLHLATLVHDDVIDDSDLRRGKETLQKKFGKKKAVICGDYLLSLALTIAAQSKEKADFADFFLPNFVSRICLGELEQYANNGNLKLSAFRYLKIIRGKTAALFEGAFLAGAIFSKEEKEYQNEYAKLGRYIGMIFQLSDDCIDFESTELDAKKPVGKDYEDGVITLPLIYTIKKNPEFKRDIDKGLLGTDEIIKQVLRFDGIGFTKGISKGYYRKAFIIIENLEVAIEKRQKLIDILEKSYNGITK